jgi:hypothetical protein
MDRLERAAIVLALVQKLQQYHSWCGETHIQKSTYFLKELTQMPLDYDFILYKHGPYSFGLTDELTAMRADAMLRIKAQPYPYGPGLVPGNTSQEVMELYPETTAAYAAAVEFVARNFGNKGIAELERLSTALFVTREMRMSSESGDRARRLHE